MPSDDLFFDDPAAAPSPTEAHDAVDDEEGEDEAADAAEDDANDGTGTGPSV